MYTFNQTESLVVLTMKIYLIILLLVKSGSMVQYNQPCTFSMGTCNWNIGRRWHIMNLDDEDKVLTADAESKEDKRIGFTDAIMSSWLHLSPLCSFDIRLTFQYSIQNENDFIEVYLIEKNRTRMSSLGQWKSLKMNQSIWLQGNVTFKASEEFRIDFEIRHLPDQRNDSTVWFGIDNILIENCPTAIVHTTSSTYPTTEILTTGFYPNEYNSTLLNGSFWKLSDLRDEFPPTFIRQNLLALILYLLCALIALTLLIILFSIIIFTYRKHCFPTPSSSPIIDPRYRMDKNKFNNRIGIQIEHTDRENPSTKTLDSSVRPCFE